MDKLSVVSIAVSTGPYHDFIKSLVADAFAKKSEYICVANVHMLVEAYKSRRFASVVRHAAYVTPDGMPLSWALRLLHGVRQERVAGMDLLPDLLKEAEATGLPVYFYGGTDALMQKTQTHLQKRYPAIKLAGTYSPPFRNLTRQEEIKVVGNINASGAAFVFVVLGCPKQEKWMAVMKGHINAVMIGMGGALPVMIGEQRRAPQWMQRAGLEWIHRLVQEPGRLFKRYAVTNPIFLYLLLKAYLQKSMRSSSKTRVRRKAVTESA